MINLAKSKISKVGFWLLVPFMSFISHTVLKIPPTIFLFAVSLSLLPFHVVTKGKLKSRKIIVLPLIISFYFLTTQPFLSPPFFRFIAIVCTLLYFVLIVIYAESIDNKFLWDSIQTFIKISVIMLVLDTIWRFIFPATHYDQFIGVDYRWIYRYKLNGFMYGDSNGTGLHLICLLFFLYYLEHRLKHRYKFIKIVLLILIFITFSRAAWLAVVIGILIFDLPKRNKHMAYIVLTSTILISPIVLLYIANDIVNDGSFASKLWIFKSSVSYISTMDFNNLLFGIGFFNTINELGIYGHNFWLIFFLESGIIGFLLMFTFFIFIYVNTKKKAAYILVPFFIASLSAITTFIPYFYGILALIYIIEKRISENRIHRSLKGQ